MDCRVRELLRNWDCPGIPCTGGAKRLKEEGTAGLGSKSRRPRSVGKPTWRPELAGAVLEMREQHPTWGKDKLVYC